MPTIINKQMMLFTDRIDSVLPIPCNCKFNKNDICTIKIGLFPRKTSYLLKSLYNIENHNWCLLRYKDEKEMLADLIINDIIG